MTENTFIPAQSLADREQAERQGLLDQFYEDTRVVTKEFDDATKAEQEQAAGVLAPFKLKMDEEVRKIAEAMKAKVDRITARYMIKQKKVEDQFWNKTEVILARTKRDALLDDLETAFKAADAALVEKYDALIAQGENE